MSWLDVYVLCSLMHAVFVMAETFLNVMGLKMEVVRGWM